jgi:hypothetical protein
MPTTRTLDPYVQVVIDKHIEPITRAGSIRKISGEHLYALLNPEERWLVQQELFNMKLDLLKFLIGEGKIPTSSMKVTLTLTIDQLAVSDTILQVSNGKRVEVPVNEHFLVYKTFPNLNEWLPLTDAEKNYGS